MALTSMFKNCLNFDNPKNDFTLLKIGKANQVLKGYLQNIHGS